ncbi:AAA family ATPase, partial [bacterium]|nr:AAA family ATPase [bacterium]
LGEIVHVLNYGGILIIDELELRLHSNLSKAIVELFSSSLNKNNAQIIFTTHNTNLLDTQCLLRRDEIYFTEKDEDGATELYSLHDFNIRSDKVVQKDYLEGIFGAVPYFNLEDLL